ncbi:MAG: hypothetical protein HQ519_14710 [Planctomycetes bacterium]|nr:hypothetical protein [Planctomycetota bacterium]
MSLRFAPRIGGKIVELISKKESRSWLWENPELPQRQPRPGDSYTKDFDSGGWDEVFPSVAGCDPIPPSWTKPITDHGELWCRAWQVNLHRQDVDGGFLRLVLDDPALPFRFERSFELAPGYGPLSLRYCVEARIPSQTSTSQVDASQVDASHLALPYLWCAHPLFRLDPGMQLHLPAGSRFNVVDQFGVGGPTAGTSIAWPISQSSSKKFFDLSHPADCPPGWAAKLFSEPLAQGWVALDSSDAKTRLVIQFDPQVLPHLGLWINRQGWSGHGGKPYNNLGVEPGTSAWDCLEDAIADGGHRLLSPGQAHQWQLEISFHNTDRPSNPSVEILT